MNKTNSAPTESSSPPRKRKWLRRLLYVVLVLIVLVLAATFVGPWAASGYVKGAIIQQIKADTGCDAAIDSLKLSLWSSRKAELAGLVIQSPDGFGGEPLLKIDRATVDASLWGALSGKLDINVAAGVDVYLVRSESGAYNFDALAAQQPAPPARPAPPKAPAPQGPRKPLPAYALHLRTNIEPINIHVIDLKENRRETSAATKSSPT